MNPTKKMCDMLVHNVIGVGVLLCLSIVDPKYGGSSTGENIAKFGGF
jgi:hypothetical protein